MIYTSTVGDDWYINIIIIFVEMFNSFFIFTALYVHTAETEGINLLFIWRGA